VLVSFRLPLRSHIALLLALLATLCYAAVVLLLWSVVLCSGGLLHSRCPEGCAHLTRCVDLSSSQRLPSSKFQVPSYSLSDFQVPSSKLTVAALLQGGVLCKHALSAAAGTAGRGLRRHTCLGAQ
jgi:hypothetical protein